MQHIIPAILESDASRTAAKLNALQGVSQWAHIDIADGEFVFNATHTIEQIPIEREQFNLELHLMVKNPENYLAACAAIGAKRVYFHREATEHPEQVVKAMNAYGFERGIALNPQTAVEELSSVIATVDAVLLLSVEPGFQGHKFVPSVLEKVSQVKAENALVLCALDGGIGRENIKDIFKAGMGYVVIGSDIWNAPDAAQELRELQKELPYYI